MAYSKDLRWRAVVLFFVYNVKMEDIGHLLGASPRSVKRWNRLFQKHDRVTDKKRQKRASRWPPAVCEFVLKYIEDHPCFYLEELQDTLRYKFGGIKVSTATICRALRFDLSRAR
jgi:transposase